MDNKKKYSNIVDRLAHLKKAPFWELFFDTALEQQFQYSLRHWYNDSIRSSSLLAALLLLASHGVDWISGVVLPLPVILWRASTILALVLTYLYAKRSRTGRWLHWLASADGLMVVSLFLLIAYSTPAPIKQIYYANIFFVQMVFFAFIRPPINFASTVALLMVVMVAPALYFDQMDFGTAAYLLFLLFAGTLLCMMVAYRMEKASRKAFLQNELIQLERDQLRDLNKQMSEQFSQDRVTRLHNRAAFEDLLMHAYQMGNSNQSLVLLAIQVERFAYFNDHAGHDSADDLLRDIARHLRNVVNEIEGAAARIGGGRFVILCRTRDDNQLRLVLEGLRTKLLAIPSLNTFVHDNIDIGLTWGGVHIQPDPERDPRGLIDRIFRHLIPIEEQAITQDAYQHFAYRKGVI